jgi:hypothetical protein
MALSGRQSMGPTVDHRVATTTGGAFFDLSNWQLAHRTCNNRKGRGESLGVVAGPGRGYPMPGDPRFCWTKGLDGWMHILPLHGEPDHWNCEWPGCRHGKAADV